MEGSIIERVNCRFCWCEDRGEEKLWYGVDVTGRIEMVVIS